ncbi:MAG: sensory rhodopsin transducer [Bacillota bacterium]
MNTEGKKVWLIPDGFLPEKSNGDFVSHEAVCVLNTGQKNAHLELTIYFEDREPLKDFHVECAKERTNHIRLDKITNEQGKKIPHGVPYAVKIDSDQPVYVQHSRMDTTQPEMALMSTIAY